MDRKKATLDLLAQKIGVSKVTISRALKGQEGVSEELRTLIIRTAVEMGYELQRLRKTEKPYKFAFITPYRFFLTTDSFYHPIYYNLNRLCQINHMDLILFVVGKEEEQKEIIPEQLKDVDGIFIGGELYKSYLSALKALGKPLIYIDFESIYYQSDCVIIDNFKLGTIATEFLIEKGYRKIGFVGNKTHSSNSADRIYGYQKAMESEGLTVTPEWIIDNYNKNTDNYMLDISLPAELPEAFICHCDRAAYYFMEKLKIENIKIPEQVALISFDNTELAEATTPPLTSIYIDKNAFAEKAFELMTHRLQTPINDSFQRIYLPAYIIERATTPRHQQ
jgi:LacI family transcriptional regulator